MITKSAAAFDYRQQYPSEEIQTGKAENSSPMQSTLAAHSPVNPDFSCRFAASLGSPMYVS